MAAQFGYTLEAGQTWGDLAQQRGQRIRDAVGGKPSHRRSDSVVAGGATTLVAAAIEGR